MSHIVCNIQYVQSLFDPNIGCLNQKVDFGLDPISFLGQLFSWIPALLVICSKAIRTRTHSIALKIHLRWSRLLWLQIHYELFTWESVRRLCVSILHKPLHPYIAKIWTKITTQKVKKEWILAKEMTLTPWNATFNVFIYLWFIYST